MRKFLAFLLLGILTLVGIGGAVLGIAQSPSGVPIDKAVNNTLNAANYTEDLVEKTPQGSETIHLVFQNPDRLGGWIESCLLYTSPSPRDRQKSRMPSSA